MNKFKTAFALLAVLVILAAPAYAAHGPNPHTALQNESRDHVPAGNTKATANFSKSLYAERQT